MEILLVRPPTTHFKNTAPPVVSLPLGLLYIAAMLEKRNFNVEIYDALTAVKLRNKQANFQKEKIHFGASWIELERKVRDVKPIVVGINNQFSSQLDSAIKMAEIVKKIDTRIITVVGGPHASAMPQTFLNHVPFIDIVVMGEGEYVLPEIVEWAKGKKKLSDIQGIAYRERDEIIYSQRKEFIQDLDELPLPAYHLIDLERYFDINRNGFSGRARYNYAGSERSISMITSRGCPFDCIFCSIHLTMGKKFRFHSSENVINHIGEVVSKYDVCHIHFEDDNITLVPERFESILDNILDKKIKITWDTPNGIRADYINQRMLEKSKASGCTYLRIGIESGDATICNKIIKKKLDLNKVIETAKLCHRIGIDLEAFYIIGFPEEKAEQMRKTIDFAIMLEEKYNVFPYDMFTATPLVGTELFKICRDKGYLVKPLNAQAWATATQGEGMIQTEDFSLSDIESILKNYRIRHARAHKLSFFKFALRNPRFLLRILIEISVRIVANPFRFKSILMAYMNIRYKNCFSRKAKVDKRC